MDKSNVINIIYYHLKPLIPRKVQIWLRQKVILRKRKIYSNVWPILERAAKLPHGWTGWPEKKQFALVLTHDVETGRGQKRCYELMEIEIQLGFRSSFNFVPERYEVSFELRDYLTKNGFEVGVHGLNHDGKLYKSRKIFKKRAYKINNYLKDWHAIGFRSPAAHHNLEWIHDLNIEYDSSTFDTDPFEPQSDGVGTIFPFWVEGSTNQKGYVELPYTLPQDFTLYVIMKENFIDIWKQKLDWIIEKGGMALIVTHPDYMNFDGDNLGMEEYPVQYYVEFLQYIRAKHRGEFWHVLPKDMSCFWSKNLNRKE